MIRPNLTRLGLTEFTPTLPKFYWDVETQEQRIKLICCLVQELIDTYASSDSQIASNTKAIEELQAAFEKFQQSGFDDYYAAQIEKWIQDNLWLLYKTLAKQVFFGLTSDGYFCAYVPDSWSEITFDTGAVYGTEAYGRLILRFDADGHGIIDNEYDTSALTDTIDARIKSAAGVGLEYDDAKFKLNCVDADEITKGISKLTHDVSNDASEERAVTSDGVYRYAPSKAQTTDQPGNNTCTEIAEGIGVTVTEVSRSGAIVMFKVSVEVTAGHTLNSYTNICRLPPWAGSGSGMTNAPTPFVLVSNGGNLQSTKSVSAGSTVEAYMAVTYKE